MNDTDKYVTVAMARHVQSAVDYCRDLIAESDQHFIESRVTLDGVGFGTCDFSAIKMKNGKAHTITIADLKYGTGIQVFADSKQLKYYAMATCQTLGIKPKWVVATILQPRLNHIDTIKIKYKELVRFYEDTLIKAAKKTVNADMHYKKVEEKKLKFNAGSHCRYCLAKTDCRALAEKVKSGPLMDELFPEVRKLSFGTEKTRLVQERIGMLSIEELGEYYEWCDLATRTASAVKEKLTSLAVQGLPLSNLKLVNGKSSRHWRDEDKAAYVLKIQGLGDKLYNQKIISVAQAEKLVDVNPALVHTTIGKPTLVPLNDRRPAMVEYSFDDATEGFGAV